MLPYMSTYNIPKKKAGLKVKKLKPASREYRQVNKDFHDSIFTINTISRFYIVNDVYEIHSPDLERKYNLQKKAWKERGYTDELTADTFSFLSVDDLSYQTVADIIKQGLHIGNLNQSVLCDPSLGAQVNKHADVTAEQILRDASRTLLVFKFMKGKVKTVDEQMEHLSEMKREPQVGFDTLTSQLVAKESQNLYLSRMYYIFHFESELDETPVKYPPQICPVAFVQFRHSTVPHPTTKPSTRSKFRMDTFLNFLETGKLPLLALASATPTSETSHSASKPSPANMSRRVKKHATSSHSWAENAPADEGDVMDSNTDTVTTKEEELFEPTADMRDRPTFFRLDKESAKWKELTDRFMMDVRRDANYFTVTEMHYIVCTKLSAKYAMTKEQWRSVGYKSEEVKDMYGYMDVTNHTIKELGYICSDGLSVGNCPYSKLADPMRGVQVSQCPDRMSATCEMAYEKLVLMCMYMPGRQLEVERKGVSELPAPSNGFDSLVAKGRNVDQTDYMSKMTYLYKYSDSSMASQPSHIYPVAFLRIKFRKKLRFKIPPVVVPDIELLKKCMSAPVCHSRTGLMRSPQSPGLPMKRPGQQELPAYAVGGAWQMRSKYNVAKQKRMSSPPPPAVAAYADDGVMAKPREKDSQEERGSDSPQPKPWLSGSKVNYMKNMLKRAVSSPAGDSPKRDEETASVCSSASSVSVGPKDSTGKDSPVSGATSTGPERKSVLKKSPTKDASCDSSSDESMVVKHVPLLHYGRRSSNVTPTYDSPTDSDGGSPLRKAPRHTGRVIESDDSELEDFSQKKRLLSQRRRTAARTHLASYSRDFSITVISHDNDRLVVPETSLSEVPDGNLTCLHRHPFIFGCYVYLSSDLDFSVQNKGSPPADEMFTTEMEPIDWALECWPAEEKDDKKCGQTKEPSRQLSGSSSMVKGDGEGVTHFSTESQANEQKADVQTLTKADLPRGTAELQPDEVRVSNEAAEEKLAVKKTSVVEEALIAKEVPVAKETSLATGKPVAGEMPSTKEMSVVPATTDRSVLKEQSVAKETCPAKETLAAKQTSTVKDMSAAKETPATKETSAAKETPATKETSAAKETPAAKEISATKVMSATKDTPAATDFVAGGKSKDSKSPIPIQRKSSSSPPADSKIVSSSSVYEEVDIFASVRNQQVDRPIKRKRKKSTILTAAPVKESPPVEPTVQKEPERKSVHFNMQLNTLHVYELEGDSWLPQMKRVENVQKEALPMKQWPLFPSTESLKLSTVDALIEGKILKPVVDASKGYMRLPELPFFHEKNKIDSTNGNAPKASDDEKVLPKMPAALMQPPPLLTEQTSTVIPGVETPYSPEGDGQEPDIYEMLEASEANKKAQGAKVDANSGSEVEPSSAFSVMLQTEVSKLASTISSLRQSTLQAEQGNNANKIPESSSKTNDGNDASSHQQYAPLEPPPVPSLVVRTDCLENNTEQSAIAAEKTAMKVRSVSPPKLYTAQTLLPSPGTSAPTQLSSPVSSSNSDEASTSERFSPLIVSTTVSRVEILSTSPHQENSATLDTEITTSELKPVHTSPWSKVDRVKSPEIAESAQKTNQVNANVAKSPPAPAVGVNDLKKLSSLSSFLLPTSLVNVPKRASTCKEPVMEKIKSPDTSASTSVVETPSSNQIVENNSSNHEEHSKNIDIALDKTDACNSDSKSVGVDVGSKVSGTGEVEKRKTNNSTKVDEKSSPLDTIKALNSIVAKGPLSLNLLLPGKPTSLTGTKNSGDVPEPQAGMKDSHNSLVAQAGAKDYAHKKPWSLAGSGNSVRETHVLQAGTKDSTAETRMLKTAGISVNGNTLATQNGTEVSGSATPRSQTRTGDFASTTVVAQAGIGDSASSSSVPQTRTKNSFSGAPVSQAGTSVSQAAMKDSTHKMSVPQARIEDSSRETTVRKVVTKDSASAAPSSTQSIHLDRMQEKSETDTVKNSSEPRSGTASESSTPSSSALKDLFKGKRLPKSLVISQEEKSGKEDSVFHGRSLAKRSRSEIDTSLSKLSQVNSELTKRDEGPSPKKKKAEDPATTWLNHLKKKSHEELQSVSKCAKYLTTINSTRNFKKSIAHDEFLDSDIEKKRVDKLLTPLFHNTQIDGCTAICHLLMTRQFNHLEVPPKSASTFFETCPMERASCTCVSFTLSQELLAKNGKVPVGFGDQDEVDTVRLAVAYSQNVSPTEHCVNISRSSELLEHIDDKRLRMLDDIIAESSFSQAMDIEEKLETPEQNFTIFCNGAASSALEKDGISSDLSTGSTVDSTCALNLQTQCNIEDEIPQPDRSPRQTEGDSLSFAEMLISSQGGHSSLPTPVCCKFDSETALKVVDDSSILCSIDGEKNDELCNISTGNTSPCGASKCSTHADIGVVDSLSQKQIASLNPPVVSDTLPLLMCQQAMFTASPLHSASTYLFEAATLPAHHIQLVTPTVFASGLLRNPDVCFTHAVSCVYNSLPALSTCDVLSNVSKEMAIVTDHNHRPSAASLVNETILIMHAEVADEVEVSHTRTSTVPAVISDVCSITDQPVMCSYVGNGHNTQQLDSSNNLPAASGVDQSSLSTKVDLKNASATERGHHSPIPFTAAIKVHQSQMVCRETVLLDKKVSLQKMQDAASGPSLQTSTRVCSEITHKNAKSGLSATSRQYIVPGSGSLAASNTNEAENPVPAVNVQLVIGGHEAGDVLSNSAKGNDGSCPTNSFNKLPMAGSQQTAHEENSKEISVQVKSDLAISRNNSAGVQSPRLDSQQNEGIGKLSISMLTRKNDKPQKVALAELSSLDVRWIIKEVRAARRMSSKVLRSNTGLKTAEENRNAVESSNASVRPNIGHRRLSDDEVEVVDIKTASAQQAPDKRRKLNSYGYMDQCRDSPDLFPSLVSENVANLPTQVAGPLSPLQVDDLCETMENHDHQVLRLTEPAAVTLDESSPLPKENYKDVTLVNTVRPLMETSVKLPTRKAPMKDRLGEKVDIPSNRLGLFDVSSAMGSSAWPMHQHAHLEPGRDFRLNIYRDEAERSVSRYPPHDFHGYPPHDLRGELVNNHSRYVRRSPHWHEQGDGRFFELSRFSRPAHRSAPYRTRAREWGSRTH